MGDGGVACVPSQHVMATISETFYGGGGNGGAFNSKSAALKFPDSNSKMDCDCSDNNNGEFSKGDIAFQELRRVEAENGDLNRVEGQGEVGLKGVEQLSAGNGGFSEGVSGSELEGGDFRKEGEGSSSIESKWARKLENKVELKKQQLCVENGKFEKDDICLGETKREDLEDQGNGFSLSSTELKLARKVEKREELKSKESFKGPKREVKNKNLSLVKGRKGEGAKLRKGKHENRVAAKEESELLKLQKGESEKLEIGSEKLHKGEAVEKEEVILAKVRNGGDIEKGEIVVDKWRKGEIEKGEIVLDRWRRGKLEREESGLARARKGETEKGEFVNKKWRREEIEKSAIGRGRKDKDEVEKGEFISDRWRNGEVEKGEIISERWRKGEALKEEYSAGKWRKREVEKGEFIPEKGWKDDVDRSPKKDTHASVKFIDDEFSRRREYSRSGNDRRKRSSRWEASSERELSCRHEHSEGKSHTREHASGALLKRDGAESESSSRKNFSDAGEHSASKSRRISEDHLSYSEKFHSRSSVERSHRASLSSKISSADRYASRQRSPHDRARRHDHREWTPGRVGYLERSPHERSRHRDHRDRSPGYLERSPRDRSRHRDYIEHSPVRSERSPHERSRHCDYRERSPALSERSPHDRGRYHDNKDLSPLYMDRSTRDRGRYRDHKDLSPLHMDRSPHDRGRSLENREAKRNSEVNGKQPSQCESQGHDEKIGQMESVGKDSKHTNGDQSQENCTLNTNTNCPDKNVKNADHQTLKENELQEPAAECKELPSEVSETHEEFQSMEEDMDICDTPPHVPSVSSSSLGKWFYLDYFGIEQGPSKLCDLKRLVEEGFLQSDHLIKHSESDRWVTVENAASPFVPFNPPSIVSDAITQLVNPPEAPGNVLVDVGDTGLQTVHLDENSVESESFEDLHIDERVTALLQGYTVVPGRELETLGEALQSVFEHVDWERWGSSEGLARSSGPVEPSKHPRDEDFGRVSNSILKDLVDARSVAPAEEYIFISNESNDWFSSLWSCKGGDWKRNDEVTHDRSLKRKVVLNEGYPLCQMPKSGYEDPRWSRKDDLYYPSHSKRLDLPLWAFTVMDEKNDVNDAGKSILASRSIQIKPTVVRGVKGTMLPVVRINACVVKDYGSFVTEPRLKARAPERHSSRSIRSFSTSSSDGGRSSSIEAISHSKRDRNIDLQALNKCRVVINTPKDRVCKVDELQLQLGDWYYLNGAGHEHGPLPFLDIQAMAAQGTIPMHSSVFRKSDNLWVPITTALVGLETSHIKADTVPAADCSSAAIPLLPVDLNAIDVASSLFHNSHPQFIGYTRGKLHELVMKSYRSREFAAAINEVLDPWITTKQPKKEMDKHFPFNSSITNGSSDFSNDNFLSKFRKSDSSFSRFYSDNSRAGKRARFLVDETDEDDEIEEDLQTDQKDDTSFEDLCGEFTSVQTESENWGLLSDRILARVFHFLRHDLRSLAFSAATCKCWNAAVRSYRDISRQVDLSFMGVNCSDSIFRNIMSGFKKTKITSIDLTGCTSVSAAALEEVLQTFPCISSVDVRGCSQFKELRPIFKNMKWIRSGSNSKPLEESHSKMRSLKQITEKNYLNSKALRGFCSDELTDSSNLESYVDRKDSVGYVFRQSCYKRTKLLNARKSSAALSRDAQMRRLLHRKSENGYKRMEEFLAISLKDIMKDNKSEFFILRVAEIEERMRNGYYIRCGLSSVKEDISRMCRDAIKAKSRGDAIDMNHIITLFVQLVKNLEESPKSFNDRDDQIKLLKDSSVAGLSSAFKHKKKHSNVTNERRSSMRSNGTLDVSLGTDYGDYTSDREIRRRLSKLNKRSFDSESDTSDDFDLSEDDRRDDADDNSSDTESDMDIHSEGGNGDIREALPIGGDESLDSMVEDREWGARMTKASLVPPVTRKYEVIDHYVIVADEEEVQRKMRVALPDDYAEKLIVQKSGTEDSDMEIPEVKDYKPRKRLGDEVLEQEVYGIDPYTHNLLLDSMSEESEWPLLERHVFIEEVLLRALNKQVRHFTGTGNTPMTYPLQPVIEEIQKTAEEEGDVRIMKMCQGLLKAMYNRLEDNYVAYRKGLGVVCNKEEGFGEEDFVVEFLGEVYPAWKWFEKQDGIRSLQKNNKDPAPEFYNIYLERPKGDRDGYDLVVVDAMHKANYASRICHSCRPNCEAKVTAVDGQYQIGIYTTRPIYFGEEITFDYNSVTESKEEYEASVCLCGSQVCRGSYLNLTGEGAFQKVMKECHGILDRHQLMLEACELNSVSHEDYVDLGRAGLGTCLLNGLPDWLVAYSARLVRFINFERTKLPDEILKHNLEEKKKYFSDVEICLDVEKSEAEIQAEGVYNQRLQNLALTLDKVRYVMRCIFGDARKAPPPLERLGPEAVVSLLWKGDGSLVQEILQCMAFHVEADSLNELKSKILGHDPTGSDDLQRELRRSLLWLRDEIRSLPCSYKCRHDAATDLIHLYAHTKFFFKVRDYKSVTSPPVYISPLDLGPKYTDKLGSGFLEYSKTYGENYCLGQLIYWHIQTNPEPDHCLARARRGCLSLPDVASFYANSPKPSRRHVYGPRTLKFMIAKMEKQPQRPWPKDRIWTFKSAPQIFGSPMFDAVLNRLPMDREVLHWLRNRPNVFPAMWDG